MKLTHEKRQEYLDYIHRGMTIKEAYEKAEISFKQGNGIIMLNMKSLEFLSKTSI